jgi:transposase-like protein
MVELVEKSLEHYQQYCSEVNASQSTKKLTLHPHKNFTCDKCGEEYEDETAYSYASKLGKSAKTYCRDCVRNIN